jgi:copper homeostasis protein
LILGGFLALGARGAWFLVLLEVIVQSVEDARAAEAGGADRLEVVREIDRGGLTPSVDLVRAIRAATSLPLRVMVRDNDGFELDPRELSHLRDATERFAASGVDGIVIGFARDGELRLDDVARVLEAAPAARATFHRAFDSLREPLSALDALAGVPQIDRVLTSGGEGSPHERATRLGSYAERAGAQITVIAGGGVTEELVSLLARTGYISEVHVGRAAREGDDPTAQVSAARVRRLRELL